MKFQENIPLAPLTTLQVGGPARFFAEAASEADVREAVAFARSRRLSLFLLGGGSNLLISDQGWPGLVLKIALTGIAEREENSKVIFTAGAGEVWDNFVARAVSRNCAGVECLSGIPGSVGGTPVQNVGAYGQEVAETITSVRALDLESGDLREFTNQECGFTYRTSVFNTFARGRYAVLAVSFALTPGGAPAVRYADLQKHFAGRALPPTLAETREAVRQIRASKGMLIIPGDDDCRSAGSFFKNPVLDADQFAEVTRAAAQRGLQIPSYPALTEHRKISAAWLVEHSGFAKGYHQGNAGISRKHALALINRGGAKAVEIFELQEAVRQRVQEIWSVHLQPEPVFVGF